MLCDFEQKVLAFIKENRFPGSADKILLAVSGGADSMALLHTLWALNASGELDTDLICAHINHQLRDSEADRDQNFVMSTACDLGMEPVTVKINVRRFAKRNKLSIETAARKLRIDALLNIAAEKNCTLIATAHQKNDNAETLIQRLARGTGFRGLGGIWPVQSFGGDICFVRPLLCVSRDEIVDYLKKRSLKWCDDSTNSDCTYRRNFIRHRLLPELQRQCGCALPEQLFELSQSARRLCGFLGRRAETVLPQLAKCDDDTVIFDLGGFLNQPELVKVELIHRSLNLLGAGLRDMTREHYGRILQLADSSLSARKIELPGGYQVWREYRRLIFCRAVQCESSVKKELGIVNLKVPGQTGYGSFMIEAKLIDGKSAAIEEFKKQKDRFVEWFDWDKLDWPLVVRPRLIGDKFRPLGSAGKKRVGKFLTDVKAPADVRNNVIIVCDNKRIIWVAPIRISEEVRVTDHTRKILQLEMWISQQRSLKL